MVLTATYHATLRANERFNYNINPTSYIKATFAECIKKGIKKNKVYPRTERDWKLSVKWRWIVFIFAKKEWNFTLITNY